MRGAVVRWSAMTSEARGGVPVPGLPSGYAIGRQYAGGTESYPPSMNTTGVDTLDADGKATIRIATSSAPSASPSYLSVSVAVADVNRQVSDAAERRGIFVNAVDDPAHATAYLGGVVRRHGVTFAISTDGRAPALAGLLREALDAWLPEDLDRWLKEADEVRRRWKLDGVPMESRRPQLLETLNRLYAERQNGRKVDEGSGDARNL